MRYVLFLIAWVLFGNFYYYMSYIRTNCSDITLIRNYIGTEGSDMPELFKIKGCLETELIIFAYTSWVYTKIAHA